MNNRYVIDFYSGSHGHFLEYVVNTWIFNGPRITNIFTETGASHLANDDGTYVSAKRITCDHFSEMNIEVPPSCEKIIRITVESFFETCCLQINVINRAGDVPKHVKESLALPDAVQKNVALKRNDYYSKFIDKKINIAANIQWAPTTLPVLEVSMSDLYNLKNFFIAMQSIARFLERRFSPDSELIDVWNMFIKLNQGVRSWHKADSFVTDVLLNKHQISHLNVEEQALANVFFSQALNKYSGELFDTIDYPSNTLDAYRILNK